MDTVETFYVLANSTGKQSDMVILYDNSVSFSKDYQGYVFGNGFLRYIPTWSDFRYIKQIHIDKDKIFIVRKKSDIVNGSLNKDGTINIAFLNKKTKKSYYGYIMFSPLIKSKYSDYFPHYYFEDITKCVKKIVTVMTQEPKERQWESVEPCENLSLKDCVTSDTCLWKVDSCSTYTKLKRQPLHKLNTVMKPYKYYMFSEFQVNDAKHSFEIHNGYIDKKPPGLWFAIGDEWLQHMKKTNFWINKYNYLYEVELNKDEIIILDNMKALQTFSETYGVEETINGKHEGVPYTFTITSNIDWYKFIKKTKSKGLIITPNFKKVYNKYSKFNHIFDVFQGLEWYITWDVASGVVWDTSTIKKLGLVYKKAQGEFV